MKLQVANHMIEAYNNMTHRVFRKALWVCAFLPLLLCACGGKGKFTVEGTIDGFGTGNLRALYATDEGVQSSVASVLDGKFTLAGVVDHPTVVRLYTGAGSLLGRLIVEPGDEITATFSTSDPSALTVKGNDDSEELAAFLAANAAALRSSNSRALNEAIDAYVAANPTHALAGLLLTDFYATANRETHLLRLMADLDPDVMRDMEVGALREMLVPYAVPLDSLTVAPLRLFGEKDSLVTFDPAAKRLSLIMITDTASRASDSIGAALTIIAARGSKIQVADLSTDPDTAMWHMSLRRVADKASPSLHRMWSPSPYQIKGMERVPVGRVPWFIVADSTRRVLYRGPEVSVARRKLGL